jgi:hypothetical protein
MKINLVFLCPLGPLTCLAQPQLTQLTANALPPGVS